MGMDIAVQTKTLSGNEDRRWLGTRMGADQCRSITLDPALFAAAHFTAKGAIPSGTLLGKKTSTGLYGPYTGNTEEVQTLTEGGSGLTSWTITFDGQTTASIDDDATPAQVQAALEALSNIAPGDVVVTGTSAPIAMTVTFGGAYADTNVAEMTTTPTGGTGTVVVATTTAGGADDGSDGRQVCAGLLFNTTQVGVVGDGSDFATAAKVSAPLFWGPGIVKEAFLPTFVGTDDGELDAQARTALASIRWEA